jgi:hypothetical protein
MSSDFTFENHGSLWLVVSHNDAAVEHLRENVSEEAQWLGDRLAVEPRYVQGLAEGLRDNGYTVGR